MVNFNYFSILLVVLYLITNVRESHCAYQDTVHVETDNDTNRVYEKWLETESLFTGLSETVVKFALPALVRASSHVDISPECISATIKLMHALKNGKLWAFKIFDSFGKPMGGQLMGSLSFLGSHYECVKTKAPNAWNPEKIDFEGKYCQIRFRPILPTKPKLFLNYRNLEIMKNKTLKTEVGQEFQKSFSAFYSYAMQIGICVPSVCADDDIKQISTYFGDKVGIKTEVFNCETDEDNRIRLDSDQKAILITISIFVITTLSLTLLEKIKSLQPQTKPNTWHKFLEAFSISANTRKVFDLGNAPRESKLSCLQGIKFMSMGWVITTHVYSLLNPLLYREGLLRSESYSKTLSFQIICSAGLSVDSFFFITGILVSYQIVSLVDKKGLKHFNIPILILRRLWRLLPSAMMTLGLVVLLPLLNEGPVWKEETNALLRPTRKNWWTVLACVSNFLPFNEMPVVSLWYISVDVQLFILALVLMLIFFKNERLSYAVIAFLFVASMISSGAVVCLANVLPVFILTAADKQIIFDTFYYGHTLPHNHVSVYIMGMMLGICFARKEEVKMSKVWAFVCWPVFLLTLFAALFSAYAFNIRDQLPSPVETFVFATFFRTVWGLGLAIMTLICSSGNGGWVNDILSWKAFIPLNRLTYLVYLLHVLLVTFLFGSSRGLVDTGDHFLVYASTATIVLSYVAAYVMKIFFEAPLCELEKLFMSKLTGTQTNKSNETSKNKEKDECKL